jgi:GDPmannose 4,6-dehydratase
MEWQGSGVEERGLVTQAPEGSGLSPGQCIVAVDERYFRPSEVETLLGDASKAKAKLGWSPKTSFHSLVSEMVREDLALAQRDALVLEAGYKAPQRYE